MNSTEVGTVSGSTLQYQQTSDLVAGEHYTFTVSAVNAINEGA
jgi:hypothetical protein